MPDAPVQAFPATELRVRFHELDPYGHVNHGVFLNYFETARIDALEHLGLGIDELRRRGLYLMVVEVHLQFRAPAFAGDRLMITTELCELRRVWSRWHQRMTRADGQVAAEVAVRAATTDAEGRPVAVPPDLSDRIIPYLRPAPR